MVLDKETKKPKGFAFAEYLDEETAESARRNLHGYEINGRFLRVGEPTGDKTADRKAHEVRSGRAQPRCLACWQHVAGTPQNSPATGLGCRTVAPSCIPGAASLDFHVPLPPRCGWPLCVVSHLVCLPVQAARLPVDLPDPGPPLGGPAAAAAASTMAAALGGPQVAPGAAPGQGGGDPLVGSMASMGQQQLYRVLAAMKVRPTRLPAAG
jgi:hypothetical protein